MKLLEFPVVMNLVFHNISVEFSNDGSNFFQLYWIFWLKMTWNIFLFVGEKGRYIFDKQKIWRFCAQLKTRMPRAFAKKQNHNKKNVRILLQGHPDKKFLLSFPEFFAFWLVRNYSSQNFYFPRPACIQKM